ncbi:amidohydrolase family protein [Acerihabitans arboris]|uniref:Amidohydrolase family protein n=1 Tax=Acerihabitans arboris TaxID=2691583 RepID=A0A845SPS8_9GAMM|nr:amidohydrolase family protein [Acerihabitans arboris]NDL64601.1 amidohydrolase family protein [Acerihabitans arboris]
MKIVDSHVHLWDPRRFSYPWLAGLPRLNRPQLPERLAAEAPALAAAVVVQADCDTLQALDEAAWIDTLAASTTALPIAGIVAYAPLEQGAAIGGYLRRLGEIRRVVGVRRSVQNEGADILRRPGYRAGMLAAARAGLCVDMCVRPAQLAGLRTLLSEVQAGEPGMRVVIDHLGKPEIAADRLDPWRDDIARLAALTGVYCKLSGLLTEAAWDCWREDQIRPFIEHALATFGPARCMFGGDWPVVELAGGYQPWFHCLSNALATLTDDERRAVWHDSAAAFYRLDIPF